MCSVLFSATGEVDHWTRAFVKLVEFPSDDIEQPSSHAEHEEISKLQPDSKKNNIVVAHLAMAA